jgi:prophage regulatory protein
MSENNHILRLNEVIARTGRSRSSIYADIDRGEFPKPIKLGARAVGWLSDDINGWIQVRVEKSRAGQC